MKYLIMCLGLACGTAYGQGGYTNQVGSNQIEAGNQLLVGIYTDYENKPYTTEEAGPGLLRATNGKWYTLEKLRYNAYDDRPEFENAGKSYQSKFEVSAFILGDSLTGMIYKNGFPAVDRQTTKSFYQVLTDGKVKLLKHTKATLLDVTSFNSATKKKRFDFSDSYYVSNAGEAPVKIKRDKKSLQEALPNLATHIDELATQHKWKLKSWEEIRQLLAEL